MKLPRLFFDTNVLESLATPPFNAYLEKIRKHLSHEFVYVLSPLTVDELLLGIHSGDEQFFRKDQAKMEVLRGVGQIRLLPFPASFALKQALEIHVNPPTASAAVVKKSIDAVIRARSKAHLEQGLVPLRLSRKTGGLNFEPIVQRHTLGKAEHARILESLRAKQVRRPTSVEWVKKSFRYFGLELGDGDWLKLASAMEAAFTLNDFLCDQAEQERYDFAKHDSDWIDVHQLFYLCDPSVHFLTRDVKLRNRIGKCGQASRIILLDEVVKALGL